MSSAPHKAPLGMKHPNFDSQADRRSRSSTSLSANAVGEPTCVLLLSGKEIPQSLHAV